MNLRALNKGAVQEPNAFLERHLLKANQSLFEKLKLLDCLEHVGFKDLGAGGVACASVELADAGGYGAEIDLDQVPTSMPHLPAHILLCSETQERFMWVVPPELIPLILTHYNEQFALPEMANGACAKVIGHIRTDGRYVVKSRGLTLVDALARDITRGLVCDRPVTPAHYSGTEPTLPEEDANQLLLTLLAHVNIASRAPILETYDKQVQGRTILEAGEANAGVLMPFNDDSYPLEIRQVGIALSLDHNPRYNQIDPYWGAVNAVVESARNVAAVGASPQAITDCLCFGNPEKPEQMWAFTEAVRGIIDACCAIGLKEYPGSSLPVIAGNVSLYNETLQKDIPPSPMISCLGSMPDATVAVTSHFQRQDSVLMLIGERKDECGGSIYYQLHGSLGQQLPKPNLESIGKEIQAITEVIQQRFVLAAHDISDGGAAVALAEMCFKNNLGAIVELPGHLTHLQRLFGESGGFILEISPQNVTSVESILHHYQIPFWIIGNTTPEPHLMIKPMIVLPVCQAKQAWENGLREKLQ